MNSPETELPEDVTRVMADIVRAQLIRGESIRIPGLGRLFVEHVPAKITINRDLSALEPPRDVIVFTSDELTILR